MSRFPALVSQLRPARDIIDALNDHLNVVDYFFHPDEAWVEMEFVSTDESSITASDQRRLDDMVFALLAAAQDTMPKGYGIQVVDGKFVVGHSQGPAADYDEPATDAESRIVSVPFCYTIPARCGLNRDQHGNAVDFYGHCYIHLIRGVEDDVYSVERNREDMRKALAAMCLVDVADVLPITEAEYRAAGYSLDEEGK